MSFLTLNPVAVGRPQTAAPELSLVVPFRFSDLQVPVFPITGECVTSACQQQLCFSWSPSTEWFPAEPWSTELQNCIHYWYCFTVRVNFYLSLYLWHLPHVLTELSLFTSPINLWKDCQPFYLWGHIPLFLFFSLSLFFLYFFCLFSSGTDEKHQQVLDRGNHPSPAKPIGSVQCRCLDHKKTYWRQ